MNKNNEALKLSVAVYMIDVFTRCNEDESNGMLPIEAIKFVKARFYAEKRGTEFLDSLPLMHNIEDWLRGVPLDTEYMPHGINELGRGWGFEEHDLTSEFSSSKYWELIAAATLALFETV